MDEHFHPHSISPGLGDSECGRDCRQPGQLRVNCSMWESRGESQIAEKEKR
jgi:hypothetical protein